MKKIFLISIFTLTGFALIAVLFFAIRQVLANREVEAEWRAALPSVPPLETTARLEILPLYEEASAGDEFISGHGVSYLIRTDAAAILMDVGNNPDESAVAPVIQNMQLLGISPKEIDAIVISHPHPDHLGGVQAWRRETISFGDQYSGMDDHPVYTPVELAYPGAKPSPGPTLLSPDVATTGLISYLEVFPISLFDPKGSEQALVVNLAGEGLVLITGCGHPTIERLIERVEDLYKLPVAGVVGGLHYEDATAQDVEPQIRFLQTRQLKLVALSPHDSSPEALQVFRSTYSEAYRDIRVGSSILFP